MTAPFGPGHSHHYNGHTGPINHHHHYYQQQPAGQNPPPAQPAQPAPPAQPATPAAPQRTRSPWVIPAIIAVAFLLALLALLTLLVVWHNSGTPVPATLTAPTSTSASDTAPPAATTASQQTQVVTDSNDGIVAVKWLGTLAHHNGSKLEIPKNGYLVSVGDLKQDGKLWYHVYKPGDNTNGFDGISGDAQFVQISGSDQTRVDQALKTLEGQLATINGVDP